MQYQDSLLRIKEQANNIKYKKYRKGFMEIQKMLRKELQFTSKEIFILLKQQIIIISKILQKNVYKKETYEFSLIENLMSKNIRNLTILQYLVLEQLKQRIDIEKLILNPLLIPGSSDEIRCIIQKIVFENDIEANEKLNNQINMFFECYFTVAFAHIISLKQYHKFELAYKILKWSFDISDQFKYVNCYKLQQKIVDIRMEYTVFLNELKQYTISNEIINQVLNDLLKLYQKKFCYSDGASTRKKKYKMQQIWKKIIITLLLSFDNFKNLQDYNRLYQINNLITWINNEIIIDSFAFKKCLHIEFDQPSKLIKTYIESNDELKIFTKKFFQEELKEKSTTSHTQELKNQVYEFYNNQMYNLYQSKKLNKKYIKVVCDQNKEKSCQKNKMPGKKSSRNMYFNALVENQNDSVKQQNLQKSYFDEDLFMNEKHKSVFQEMYKQSKRKSKNNSMTKLLNPNINNFISAATSQATINPKRNNKVAAHPASKVFKNQQQKILKADEIFFKNFIVQNCNLNITSDPNFQKKHQRNLLKDENQKKQSNFQKKILKMKHNEQLPLSNLNSFVNLIAQKRKIKREQEFINAIVQIQKPPVVDVYTNKDQHGMSIPLKGIELFVEIILQNRGILGIRKLAEKHDLVRKKRQNQNKSKKRNEEKERLKLLYKIQEGKRSYMLEQTTLTKLNFINHNKRKKIFNKNKINFQFLDLSKHGVDYFSKNDGKLKKQIELNNVKSQETIKQVSEKIENNLREQSNIIACNKNKKLRKINMFDERFNNLRQSINTSKINQQLDFYK